MDIQTEKIKLIEWLVGLNDVTILRMLTEVKKRSTKKSCDSRLQPLSIEELKTRALESEEAIKTGDCTSFEQLKDEMQAW